LLGFVPHLLLSSHLCIRWKLLSPCVFTGQLALVGVITAVLILAEESVVLGFVFFVDAGLWWRGRPAARSFAAVTIVSGGWWR
jgi:hypothetical protein